MAEIVALVAHRTLRARLRTALGTRHYVTMLEHVTDLWRVVQTDPVALVIVEANGDALADAPATIAALRTEYPVVAIAAYCMFGPGVSGAILDLARAGVHEIVVAGFDDERHALETVVAQALRRSTADDVMARLAPLHLPDPVVRAIRVFLNSAGRPITIEYAADLLGVHRRTLVSRCAAGGLPTPRALAMWSRLLVAARLLDSPALTVEQVAHTLAFPSANALRNLFHRHAGVSPSGLGAQGGYAWLRDEFVARLAPSAPSFLVTETAARTPSRPGAEDRSRAALCATPHRVVRAPSRRRIGRSLARTDTAR